MDKSLWSLKIVLYKVVFLSKCYLWLKNLARNLSWVKGGDVLGWSVFEIQNFKILAWYTEKTYYVHSVLLI